MEARDFYDLFFIAIIAIVLARAIKRRQGAEERRRARLLESREATRAELPADDGVVGSPDAGDGTPRSPDPDPVDRSEHEPPGQGGRAGSG